jgi:hypothetical protein
VPPFIQEPGLTPAVGTPEPADGAIDAAGTFAPGAEARPPLTVELADRQRLHVIALSGRSELRLMGADGAVRLLIAITPDGPVLRLAGAGVRVEVSGDLTLEARRLALVGREELALSSGGALRVTAAGPASSAARSQEIVADRGDVRVKANDDVRLDGERIRMNC